MGNMRKYVVIQAGGKYFIYLSLLRNDVPNLLLLWLITQ
jgi:hypothetical protein